MPKLRDLGSKSDGTVQSDWKRTTFQRGPLSPIGTVSRKPFQCDTSVRCLTSLLEIFNYVGVSEKGIENGKSHSSQFDTKISLHLSTVGQIGEPDKMENSHIKRTVLVVTRVL